VNEINNARRSIISITRAYIRVLDMLTKLTCITHKFLVISFFIQKTDTKDQLQKKNVPSVNDATMTHPTLLPNPPMRPLGPNITVHYATY
jgi:hypothetical protein